ncbi:zinc transporter [Anaerocolumna cellulosilytica]|uniref:Zinc transporter n=1 Tax=Anaerocolumna cellulosilytica TaxID=433286 RepID=A0A6S6QTJ4_9FIRM|nr:ZIP family metal transporter [Anaerocolumna cellulosilytica]MBB5195668.1 ZIP family zinc transporter [Anaerocolumna cellulosilytica]BCJ92996.1 zinc transporter [Anaerocolumna cellulosilytica]
MNPVLMALLGGLFTWGMTAAGAAMVFFFKEIKPKTLNLMLGFASGVMIAASFWSLLLPALELSESTPLPWLPVVGGFGLGGLFLYAADRFFPHVHHVEDEPKGRSGVKKAAIRRSILLVTAITLHNIPEGLSYGVAFGTIGSAKTATLASAVILAIGIGLQNFPEGAAVSIPLRRDGQSRMRSFMYGQASGIVEPIAAVIGAWLASSISWILPYALAFAAGAMIFVVVEELIPESQNDSHLYGHSATLGTMIGFMVMTLLDIALG